MSIQYSFTMDLKVHDVNALYQAALQRAQADGLGAEEAQQHLLVDAAGPAAEPNIDIGGCLVMLLDPGMLDGCDIDDSSAEEVVRLHGL